MHIHHDHDHDGSAAHDLGELLDLDGEVLAGYWHDVLDRVTAAAPHEVRTIVDLGAGTGVGTMLLAARFPAASVVAVDQSADMLERITGKARVAGLADRVRGVVADLDSAELDLEPVDLTWASMSMHHLADPDTVLRSMYGTTRPGGVIALVEMTEVVRFLPDDVGIGRPGLEQRCLAQRRAEHEHTLPHMGSDWAARIGAAGFTDVTEDAIAIDVAATSPAAVRYAWGWLNRLRAGIGEHLDADDQRTLTALIDGDGPHALKHRDDLWIRGTRTLTLGRRAQ